MKTVRRITIAAIVFMSVLAAAQAAADDMLGVYKLAIDNDPQFKGASYERSALHESLNPAYARLFRKSTGRGVTARLPRTSWKRLILCTTPAETLRQQDLYGQVHAIPVPVLALHGGEPGEVPSRARGHGF